MNKEEHQKQLKGMFEFLKGLNLSGVAEFASYEDWQKAKITKPTESMYSPPVSSPQAEPKPEKFTDVKGEAGFAMQHALREQKYFFDNLTEDERLEYEQAFNDSNS